MCKSFLCLRRGVSHFRKVSAYIETFSLPTQRCFFGGRLADPDAEAFLCLRRGVSHPQAPAARPCLFSLPTQRCFLFASAEIFILRLFSAYAEVFPSSQPLSRFVSPFLCLRRGVSAAVNLNGDFISFSLPTQRCFWMSRIPKKARSLFSAYAEVFPLVHELGD